MPTEGQKDTVAECPALRTQASLLTEEDVAKHNQSKDLWLIIDNKVYDVTQWAPKHPGGPLTLFSVGGRDASEIFEAYHPPSARKMLSAMQVGQLERPTRVSQLPLIQDFRVLRSELIKEGLFKTDYWYYFKKHVASAALFAAAWWLQVRGAQEECALMQILAAVCLGTFFQQVAFIGHDAGHSAIFQNRVVNLVYGLVLGAGLQGISLAWWKDSHNTHHVVPNQVQIDPDIQHLPFFAVTARYFQNVYSYYHGRVLKFDFLSRFVVQYQHLLFYPIMALARTFLYLQSYILIFGFKPRPCPYAKFELAGMITFALWLRYFLSFSVTTSTGIAIFFLSHAIAGMLHLQICLNHFAMETTEGDSPYTEAQDFVRLQLGASTDISNPKWLDWFHGGLQFQLAHHLFPRMPRHSLQTARDRVMSLLSKHGLRYNIVSFTQANKLLIKCLREQAIKAQNLATSSQNNSHMLWDALNARG